MCPYYESRFSNKEELSKPIDILHLGSGLLEGDLRQWGIFNLVISYRTHIIYDKIGRV
jgi:hypothetical protein